MQFSKFYRPKSLNDLLVLVLSREIPQLSSVCYYPNITSYMKLFEEFIEPKKFPHQYKMLKNPLTLLLLTAIQETKDIEAGQNLYHVLTLHIYSILMRKFIKYCNPKRLTIALQKLSGKHLFKKMGIEKALLYTSSRIFKRYGINLDDNQLIKMYLELRTMIAQMVRALARRYYSVTQEEMEEKPSIAEKLTPIIVQRISVVHNDTCFDKAATLSKTTRKDIQYLLERLISNGDIHDYVYVILSDVDRKSKVCSPVWYAKKVKSLQTKPLILYLRKYKDVKLNVHEGLLRYMLCYIRSLVC